MAISTDPNDPHFGLESDVSSPNFGLPVEQPESSGFRNGLETVQQVLGKAGEAYISSAGGGGALLHKLAFPGEAKLQETPLVSTETIEPIRKALQYPAQTLGNVVFGENFQEPLPALGHFASEQIAGQTSPENLALLAVPGIIGGMPKLREVAFGKPPSVPEVPPAIPPEYTERRFQLVPEPPPEIAPAPTIEQTLETATVPEARVSPETGFTFPNEPIETRTNVPSETATIGGDINATQEGIVQESSVAEHKGDGEIGTPAETGGSGSIEPSSKVEGTQEVAQQAEPQPPAATAPPPEVPPAETTPQLEVPPETTTSGVHAEALSERPIDEIPAGTEVGWQEARQLGNDFLDKGGSINKVIADFNRTGKLSLKDIGAGRAYLERLQAVTDRTQDALRDNPSDPLLQQNYGAARAMEQRFSEDFKPMATAASNQLKGFQGKVPLTDDMADSFTALSRKYGEIKGKPMTPEEVVKADRLAKQNAKVKTEYQGANDQLYQKIDTEYGRIRTNRTAAPTLEDLGKTFGQTLKEVCEV